MITRTVLIGIVMISLLGCLADREFPAPNSQPPIGSADSIVFGTLRINEFVATASSYDSEFSTESDWIEIYNTSLDSIDFGKGTWYLTDTLGNPTKWKMPDTTIAPRGFIVIWCDDFDTVATQIHSNFKLSSNGESIGLYFKKSEDDSTTVVDYLNYTLQSAGYSNARYPDGTINWIQSFEPSPNETNEP